MLSLPLTSADIISRRFVNWPGPAIHMSKDSGIESPWYVVLMKIQTVWQRGQGPRTCPWKITSCHLFPRRKNWYKQSPPSPLELSGSAHACPTVEFYFLLVAGLAIILSRANWLRWCAGWSAPLLFACNSNNVPMEWGKKKQTLIRRRDHLKAVQMPNCVELSSK